MTKKGVLGDRQPRRSRLTSATGYLSYEIPASSAKLRFEVRSTYFVPPRDDAMSACAGIGSDRGMWHCDDAHSRRQRRFDARGRILEHDASLRLYLELICGGEED